MRKLWWMGLLLLVLGFATPAMAQNNYSPFEAYVGYDFLHATCCGSPSLNFNGGSGEFSFNANNWVAAVADVAGYTGGSPVNATVYTYQFGPRIYFSRGTVRPFAQVLLGGVHASSALFGVSANGFNMDLGGGVDISVSPHFAIRPVEMAYERSHFSLGPGFSLNNFRYSAGIVFRF